MRRARHHHRPCIAARLHRLPPPCGEGSGVGVLLRHRRRTKHRMGCASENTPTHPSPQGGGSSPATAVAENLSPPPHRSVSSPHCPRAGRDRERTVCGDRIGWRGSRPPRRSSGRPDVSPVRGGDESCGGCPVPQSGSGYCGTGEDPAVRRNEVKNPGRAGGTRPRFYLRTTALGSKPRRRSPLLPHPPGPDGCRAIGAGGAAPRPALVSIGAIR